MNAKVEHVLRAGQTRDHTCHWPGCEAQVPPAMWGCRAHWYRIPKELRDKVWKAYRPGQEERRDPSRAYMNAAREVHAWIAKQTEEESAQLELGIGGAP
jgi:hypothetical protein